MTLIPQIDPEVLAKSPAERIQRFKQVKLRHHALVRALDRALLQLHAQSKRNVIAVIGPSSVGKTELLKQLRREILNDATLLAAAAGIERSSVPCPFVELASTTGRSFDFADMFLRILAKLSDPFLARWEPQVISSMRAAKQGQPDEFFSVLEGIRVDLRFALESALRYRRPIAILLDEIHHACVVPRGREISEQSEVFKSVANISGTRLVCAGTEKALPLFDGDAQIMMRSRIIPLLPYGDSPTERSEFMSYATGLFQRLPVAAVDDAVLSEEYLVRHTLRAAGALKDWIQDALPICLRDNGGAGPMLRKHMDEVRPRRKQVEQFHAAVEVARRALEDAGDPEDSSPVPAPIMALPTPSPPRRRQGRVGHRAPSKDPIGGAIDD